MGALSVSKKDPKNIQKKKELIFHQMNLIQHVLGSGYLKNKYIIFLVNTIIILKSAMPGLSETPKMYLNEYLNSENGPLYYPSKFYLKKTKSRNMFSSQYS